MRTLSRPMFNMGGPIKQGIMHGIREPKKHGGLSKQFNTGLVGDERYPKTKGREHHVGFLAPLYWAGQAALRMGPAAYRGWKASRALTPWSQNLGKWGRFKDTFLPKKSLRLQAGELGKQYGAGTKAGEGLGFGIGSFARSNPVTTIGLASAVPQAGYAAGKLGAAAPGALWSGAKRYADMVIPGDQSRWWKEKEAPTGVPGVPGGGDPGMYYDKNKKVEKKLSEAERKAFALKQREERVQRYLDMMGYDRAKKTAIADALIDASKIVSDRGSLDPKNITQELINPIIQATSKRLDKPDQIREAVGLMATKAEIEKDLEDPSIKALRLEQLKELRGGFEKDIGAFILSAKGTKVKPDALERYARIKANEYGIDFTKITDETVTNAAGTTEEEKIQNVVGDDGIYMIGDAIIKVTGGIPKHIG